MLQRSALMRRTTATRRGMLLGAATLAPFRAIAQSPVALLNVSYDPTREF
jgi:ABC-type sulfate transport system substrate-binding protein